MCGNEIKYIGEAHAKGHLAGDGDFTMKCHAWLEKRIGCHQALLTHSCTAALEMAAILADIQPGDEIIMPSYTFVSTANAFVLRGGIPVFVDIRADTLNIDETKIEARITTRTKAIVPVHYAGVACEMDVIMSIAEKYNLIVIEDAAQGIMSSYKQRPLGSIGHMATLSFHETKNIISGEGGALLINDARFSARAEIIRNKGTNRSEFLRDKVDKYTWVDIGSSYLPGEVIAAFLWAQMEEADEITRRRLDIWNIYHKAFANSEQKGLLRQPVIPAECQHNAHMYYLLMQSPQERTDIIKYLQDVGIGAVFHYVPLHSTPFGEKNGDGSGDYYFTNSLSEKLIRLPLWIEMTSEMIDKVINEVIHGYYGNVRTK